MKRFTLLFSVILLSLFSFAGDWTPINGQMPGPIQYKVIEANETHTVVRFNLNGFYTNTVVTPQGKASIISVPKMVSLSEVGAPNLPKYAISTIIGDNDLMDAKVVSSAYTDFHGISIAPSKGDFSRKIDPETVPYTYGSAYSQNSFYPATNVELQEAYILRNFRGQAATIMPFAYNPITKTLRVYHDITIEIFKEGVGGANVLQRKSNVIKEDMEFDQLYQHQFVNYNAAQSRYPILSEQGKLLIISHGPYMAAMAPFVEWKKTIGRETEIVDVATIGTTPDAIKTFITNYYNTNGLTYLLLVGDHQHVPSYNNSSSGGYSDNYYAYLAGNDSYNELFVGRFSAESVDHVNTQVQKVITYERDLNQTATWLNIGTGIARNEGSGNGHNGGEADYVHMNYIRDTLLNYTYATVHQEYDGGVPGITNTTAAQISSRINAGTSIINYCNHGSQNSWSVAGYATSDVNNLTNTDRWPIIWAVACDNGRFTNGSCFAETWMRATKNGQPTGAIATMMSWISQPWQPPMTGQDEMVTILSESYANNIKRTFGGNSTSGSMKMVDLHGTSGRSTHDTWIMFGDPSLTLRTAPPVAMNVSHMPTIFLGMTEFTVNADAEGALVALTINGEILGTGTISGGTTTISFPAINNVGVLKIAVFGYNKVTYLQDIEIIPASGPFIAYVSATVNGAVNNQIHYGQDVSLGIQLRNLGIANATNITATLSTTSPFVTITDATQSYGTMTPDQVMTITDAFALSLSNEVPNNTPLTFSLLITADEGTWENNFNMNALAPSFTVGDFIVNDQSGNGNGRLDPGETATIKVAFTNSGLSQANDAIAHLVFNSSYITVNTGTFEAVTVAPDQTLEASFNITVSGATPIGQAIVFNFDVAAGAYQAAKEFSTKIGIILEGFETGDFTAFDWTSGGVTPWVITNTGAFEGTYTAKSGSITNNQTTQLILQYEVSVNDSISFYRKVSSESGYDFMRFYIDNVKVGEWAGEIAWSKVGYAVTAGTHTFKWEFMKDVSVAGGSDCAWVDFITLPATITTNGWAGNNAEICEGNTFQINATAANYTSLSWTTSGTGTFSNTSILNPIYTPSLADIAAGNVVLKLTVNGSTTTIESQMTLNIHHSPEAFAGETTAICHGNNIELVASDASNYSALLWSTSGDGTFSDATLMHPVYSPGATDMASGMAALTLTAEGNGGCAAASHAIELTINALPTATISGDQTICEGQSATLTFELTGSAPWIITLADMDPVNATATPMVLELTPYSGSTYTLISVEDGNNCANEASGQAVVTMNTAPLAPMTPSAPDTVDHAFVQQSNVSIETVADATSYNWMIEPEAAGTIAGNETNAVVSWNSDFIGTATIKAAAINLCGQSSWSVAAEVIVKSTVGLNENEALGLRLYPNPTSGSFTLQLNSLQQKQLNIRVTNVVGELVYSETLESKAGLNNKILNLEQLPNGVYMVIVENGATVSTQRLTIRK